MCSLGPGNEARVVCSLGPGNEARVVCSLGPGNEARAVWGEHEQAWYALSPGTSLEEFVLNCNNFSSPW